MASSSDKLSQTSRLNEMQIGSHAGKSSADINGPRTNRLYPMPDEDCDGKADVGVSRELSEDVNAKLWRE